jgi:hypothetical protein
VYVGLQDLPFHQVNDFVVVGVEGFKLVVPHSCFILFYSDVVDSCFISRVFASDNVEAVLHLAASLPLSIINKLVIVAGGVKELDHKVGIEAQIFELLLADDVVVVCIE